MSLRGWTLTLYTVAVIGAVAFLVQLPWGEWFHR